MSTVRNIVRKWKTTSTVLVKARSGRPSKIRKDGENGQKQTTSKDLQHNLATDGVTVHRSTIQCTLHKEKLYGRVMRKKYFLHTRHRVA